MNIVVGGILEKDGKVLLVQEAKEKCYGKWNIPAGRLEYDENMIDAALREIKEETGCDVELTGLLSFFHNIVDGKHFVAIIFSTKLLSENIKFNKEEILNVKWFDIDEIINNMSDELRDIKFIKHSLINLKNKNIAPLNVINEI